MYAIKIIPNKRKTDDWFLYRDPDELVVQCWNEKEDAEIVKNQQIGHDKASVALKATSVLSDDGIIDPRDTRDVLGICLSVVNNKKIKGSKGFGVFRL